MKARLPFWLILILVFTIVVIGLLGTWPARIRWLLTIATIMGFLVLIGRKLCNRWDGIFIDSRYKMSLARFQIFLWTLLTFSAFLTIAFERNYTLLNRESLPQDEMEKLSGFDPLNILFPRELLLALGIGTASLAGASIIKNAKKESGTGRRLELLIGEREKIANRQAEAQKAMNQAIDLAKQVAAEKNSLKKGLDTCEAEVAKLKTAADAKQTELAAVRQQLTQNPNDQALQAKDAELAGEFQELGVHLKQAEKARDGFNARYAAGIAAIALKSAEAGTAEEKARITYERASEELKRSDDALKKKEGLIHKNEGPQEADWIDMFRGDEVGNHDVIDISKVQMFFFTVAIVMTYAVLVWLSMNKEAFGSPHFAFPAFSDSMNALLGLSHAGYLVVKGTG